jgi:hypothetical protein
MSRYVAVVRAATGLVRAHDEIEAIEADVRDNGDGRVND